MTLVVWGAITNIDLLSGINNGQKHFLCDARSYNVNPGWIAGIDNYEEFAENFSTMVKYLIEEKHYTCINQITPFNEPDSHIAGYGRIMCKVILKPWVGRTPTPHGESTGCQV